MNNAEVLRALDETRHKFDLCGASFEYEVIRNHLTDPGYVRVPVEPTAEMLDVAVSHALMVAIRGNYTWTQYMSDVWARMLAASTKEQTNG